LLKPPMKTTLSHIDSVSRPPYVLQWSILCAIPHKARKVTMLRYDDVLSDAEDFIALARQYQTDGDAEEAEVNVAAAVSTLEWLLRPVESDAT
jgi:hypothetical protein